MTTRSTRALALAAPILTLGLVAAGCGGSESAQGPDASTANTPAPQAAAASPATCPEQRSEMFVVSFTNMTDELITIRTEPGWSCALFSGTGTPARLDMLQIPPRGERSPAKRLERASSRLRDSTLLFGLSFYAGRERLQIMPIGGMPAMGVWDTFPRPLKYAVTAGTRTPKSFDRESGVLSSSLPSGVKVKVRWFTAVNWQGVDFTFRPE